MADSRGPNRDDAKDRRAEIATLLEANDYETVTPFVGWAISGAVDRIEYTEHDEREGRFGERALEEYADDHANDDCVDGRPYCYLCNVISEQRNGGRV